MTVTVILPQFGRSELTIGAVRSLQRYHRPGSFNAVVVDDGSSLNDLKCLQKSISGDVQIVTHPRRLGVTRAWNLGTVYATGEIVVFLNNDTLTKGPWLDRLTGPLIRGESQLCGCRARQEPDLPQAFRSLRPTAEMIDGSCFAISRELLCELQGFDERFELYYSDTDLQCRLIELSRERQPLRVVNGLPLSHLGHRSADQLPDRRKIWRGDRRRFLRKWLPTE